MSYHPIMGISIFIAFLILSFILGRHIGNLRKEKKQIDLVKKSKLDSTSSIAPDANWID